MAQVAAIAGPMAVIGVLGMMGQPTVKHNAPELGTSASYIAPPGDPNSSSTSENRASGKRKGQTGQQGRGGSRNAANGTNATAQQSQVMMLLISCCSVLAFLLMGVLLAFAIAS